MTRSQFALALAFSATAVLSVLAQPSAAKKGYLVGQIDVSNPQQYAEYQKLTPGIIEKFGGRFVARGGQTATLEGPPAQGRVVIIEFPSFQRAQEFYNSPDYTAAKKVRAGAATVHFVLVEGV